MKGFYIKLGSIVFVAITAIVVYHVFFNKPIIKKPVSDSILTKSKAVSVNDFVITTNQDSLMIDFLMNSNQLANDISGEIWMEIKDKDRFLNFHINNPNFSTFQNHLYWRISKTDLSKSGFFEKQINSDSIIRTMATDREMNFIDEIGRMENESLATSKVKYIIDWDTLKKKDIKFFYLGGYDNESIYFTKSDSVDIYYINNYLHFRFFDDTVYRDLRPDTVYWFNYRNASDSELKDFSDFLNSSYVHRIKY